MVVRMRRQSLGEIDAAAVDELTAARESNEHSRVAVLCDTDDRFLLALPLRHVLSPKQATAAIIPMSCPVRYRCPVAYRGGNAGMKKRSEAKSAQRK